MAGSAKTDATPDQDSVENFLRDHPDFLVKRPELLAILTPPAQDHGGNSVVDFQHYQLKNLQATKRDLQSRYDVLVEYCRDNLSVQTQVHDAALRLVHARDLSQLLEVLTLDLVSLFDVDVVRLAVESDAAMLYDTYYNEANYSGIVFIPPGVVAEIFGPAPQGHAATRQALLVADEQEGFTPGFDEVFAECSRLVRSFALLRLHLPQLGRDALLAFGVRHPGRFQPAQGVELLSFLARIVAHRLDRYLSDIEGE